MFIRKDLRKIPKILDDAVDIVESDILQGPSLSSTDPQTKRVKRQEALQELRLGRRSQEFQGNVRILCQPQWKSKLTCLESLNLYDCNISNLDGLGTMFAESSPKLQILNLGRNPLKNIPDEFARLQSLKHLWLDDCHLQGPLPRPLMELQQLTTLRLPNNQITCIQSMEEEQYDNQIVSQGKSLLATHSKQLKLKILCLDRNRLTELPKFMTNWVPNLEELFVRHNQLKVLKSTNLPSSLRVLHVSSNQLSDLNALMQNNTTSDAQCPFLTYIYANSNQIRQLPEGIIQSHQYLQRLVISHNPLLKALPNDIWDKLQNTTTQCEIVWQPNPSLLDTHNNVVHDYENDHQYDPVMTKRDNAVNDIDMKN